MIGSKAHQQNVLVVHHLILADVSATEFQMRHNAARTTALGPVPRGFRERDALCYAMVCQSISRRRHDSVLRLRRMRMSSCIYV